MRQAGLSEEDIVNYYMVKKMGRAKPGFRLSEDMVQQLTSLRGKHKISEGKDGQREKGSEMELLTRKLQPGAPPPGAQQQALSGGAYPAQRSSDRGERPWLTHSEKKAANLNWLGRPIKTPEEKKAAYAVSRRALRAARIAAIRAAAGK